VGAAAGTATVGGGGAAGGAAPGEEEEEEEIIEWGEEGGGRRGQAYLRSWALFAECRPDGALGNIFLFSFFLLQTFRTYSF